MYLQIDLNPKQGQYVMGCTDTSPAANPYKLSRIYDSFIAAVKAEIDPEVIWKTLPYDTKVEMNYSNWTYVKP